MFITSSQTNKISAALLALCIIAFNMQNGVIEVVCAIVSVYGLAIAIKNRDVKLFQSPVLVLIIALWMYLILVSIISDYPKNSISNALPSIRLPLFTLAVGYMLYLNKGILPKLIQLIAFVALCISINAIIQFYIGHDLLGNLPFDNGSIIRLTNLHGKLQVGYMLSIFAALIMGYLAVLLRDGSSKLLTAFIAISMLATFAAVLISGERAPFILMVANLLILILSSVRLRISLPILLVAFLSVAAYVNHNPYIKYRLIDNTRNELTNFFQSSSYGMIYSNAFAIVEHYNPLYGSGAKSFKDVCNAHDVPFPDYCANHPHNLYIEMLVAGGVPALMIFLSIVVLALKNMAVCIMNNRENYIYISCASYIALKLLPVIPAPSLYIAWASYPLAFVCGVVFCFHVIHDA